MLISDGIPDFNPVSVLNQIYLYDFRLDLLSVFTYAVMYSAFNPIEHLWSVMINKLSGVLFNPTIEVENKPPVNQSGLSKDKCERKEAIVFNTAMAECKAYWENLKFNDNEITTKVIQTNNNKLICDNYERVKAFLSRPIRDIHKYSDLAQEFKKMFEHIDRHANEKTFV